MTAIGPSDQKLAFFAISAKTKPNHFHVHTFTFTLVLSHFLFHTFIFTLSLSHFHTFTLSFSHFHTCTFTLSHFYFHTFTLLLSQFNVHTFTLSHFYFHTFTFHLHFHTLNNTYNHDIRWFPVLWLLVSEILCALTFRDNLLFATIQTVWNLCCKSIIKLWMLKVALPYNDFNDLYVDIC